MTIADITAAISFFTKTTTTSFPAADRLYLTNNAYERVVSLILKSDGRWQWDDTNFTTFPIATATLVNGQKDYKFDVTHLRVLKIEILDASGKYYLINQIDFDDIEKFQNSITEYRSTSGRPLEYDVQGPSIVLYPAPDNGVSVTLATGLKVYFQRGPQTFTAAEVTAGTKSPGFNSLYHKLIPLWVAYDYWMTNEPAEADRFMAEIVKMEAALIEDYSHRNKAERNVMNMKKILFR